MEPAWLVWARELQAIAQIGLTFTTGTYDRERYTAIRSLAARIMVTHSDANFVRVEGLFAEHAGYATPKVDVRGAVIEDGRILLAREIEDAGRWTMPGGWADVNQSPSESVIREMREESGLEVRVRKLAAVYDRARQGHTPPHPFHVYKLFFICDVVGGAPKAGLETSEVAFFGENEIPEDLSVARVLPHQIARMFRARTVQRLADRIRLIGINVGDDRACSCRRFAAESARLAPTRGRKSWTCGAPGRNTLPGPDPDQSRRRRDPPIVRRMFSRTKSGSRAGCKASPGQRVKHCGPRIVSIVCISSASAIVRPSVFV